MTLLAERGGKPRNADSPKRGCWADGISQGWLMRLLLVVYLLVVGNVIYLGCHATRLSDMGDYKSQSHSQSNAVVKDVWGEGGIYPHRIPMHEAKHSLHHWLSSSHGHPLMLWEFWEYHCVVPKGPIFVPTTDRGHDRTCMLSSSWTILNTKGWWIPTKVLLKAICISKRTEWKKRRDERSEGI